MLHGQLSTQTLTLESPTIAFPWPLPSGPKTIAPPAWLAALHAQIHHGDISLGGARFSNVDADLFTGENGAVTISGTGILQGYNLSLTAALGAAALTGTAPLSITTNSGAVTLNFSGNLSGTSALAGQLSLAAPLTSGSANLTTSGTAATATGIHLNIAKASLTGSATLDFTQPTLAATLDAQNLDLTPLQSLATSWPSLPVALTLSATNLTYGGHSLPALQTSLSLSPSGLNVHSLQATLPGSTTVAASLQVTPPGALTGQASLNSPDLSGLLTAFGLTPPTAWTTAQLSTNLSGTIGHLSLSNLTGSLGPSHVTGGLIITGPHTTGALAFDRLDLTPLLSWLGQRPGNFTADGQITATRASLGPVPLTHLLLDGELTTQLNIRRISANVLGGLASGSLTLDAASNVTAARGFLSLPSAAPLAALLPPRWQILPAALVQPRLSLTLAARGPSNALATSAVATLGAFTLTAAPVLNLAQSSATGTISLQHPSAIAALAIFGLSQGITFPGPGSVSSRAELTASPTTYGPPDFVLSLSNPNAIAALNISNLSQGGAFPGPGSLSLRANFTASPTTYGLPDFVLSLGNLTASGRVLSTKGIISGQIAADTLALPSIPANYTLPWNSLASAQGKITLAANRILYGGIPILGATTASLTFTPNNSLTLALPQASLAGGTLTGTVTAASSNNLPPALTAQFSASHIDPTQLNLPLAFPYTLSGNFDASGSLTATGYSPRIWAATLGGTTSLNASNGRLYGFSLQGVAEALQSPNRAHALRAALASGSTGYTALALSGSFDHGNCTLTTGSLAGPAGTASATGSVDIYDNSLALRVSLHPYVAPPLTLNTAMLGNWSAPKQYPRLKPAMDWSPPAPKPAAATPAP